MLLFKRSAHGLVNLRETESDPPPLGGHAVPLGILLPRWLALLIVGSAAALSICAAGIVWWLL